MAIGSNYLLSWCKEFVGIYRFIEKADKRSTGSALPELQSIGMRIVVCVCVRAFITFDKQRHTFALLSHFDMAFSCIIIILLY